MKKSLFAFSILASLSFSTSGQAQSFSILGAGASACSKYLSDSAASPAYQSVYLNWAMGYFTAINVSNAPKAGAKTINGTSGVESALKGFCLANPNKNFSDAVLSFALQALK